MSESNNTPEERWLAIPGWEGIYSVSDWGRVRRDALLPARFNGIEICPSVGQSGYFSVSLKGIHRLTYRLHRIVMLAFIGPCPDGKQVNHIDGVKSNNRIENLEYVTPSQNEFHKTRVLKKCVGEDHYTFKNPEKKRMGTRNPAAVLTDADVHKIREMRLIEHVKVIEIARIYKVHHHTIENILYKKTWTHI